MIEIQTEIHKSSGSDRDVVLSSTENRNSHPRKRRKVENQNAETATTVFRMPPPIPGASIANPLIEDGEIAWSSRSLARQDLQ
jgi:hypothetical protein